MTPPLDNIFEGDLASAFHDVVGEYGDEFRLALLNPIVAHVLDYFASSRSAPVLGRHKILEEALDNLPVRKLVPNAIGVNRPVLLDWHRSKDGLLASYASLSGARLWDIGAGNCYLGGWLSGIGVDYLGIEPSSALFGKAKADGRLENQRLLQATIQGFCADGNAWNGQQPPTLMTALMVLDHCGDPEGALLGLSEAMKIRDWSGVPILFTTADPDFFLPGLPTARISEPPPIEHGPMPPRVRDPAIWEELFSRTGFLVLEQRPVHLNLLPPALAADLERHHAEMFRGEAGRVPPRQGPFHFWLVAARKGGAASANAAGGFGEGSGIPVACEDYAAGERIEIVGNLGSRIYRVEKGGIDYRSKALELEMAFGKGEIFGQLEVSGDYVASRVLGSLITSEESAVSALSSVEFRRLLDGSKDLGHEIFLSMMRHLDSVRYESFMSAKRVPKNLKSNTLMPQNNPAGHVLLYAAALLHCWVNSIKYADYRSKAIFMLGRDKYKEMVYDAGSRQDIILNVIPSFVQSSIIDCFSPCLINAIDAGRERGNYFQDDISDLPTEDVDSYAPLHLGWQVAYFLDHNIPDEGTDIRFDRISELATLVGMMLGCTTDIDRFADEHREGVKLEKQDKSLGGRNARPRRPDGPAECKALILEKLAAANEDGAIDGRAATFLDKLCDTMGFVSNVGYRDKLGLCDIVVVRDIWALLACLLDDDLMWSYAKEPSTLQALIAKSEQRPRLTAYFQECIAYLGKRAGFDSSPW